MTPARAILGDLATEQEVEALRDAMGLNDPLPVQYVEWIKGVCHGDLGDSIFIQQPMTQIIREHLVPTINLTIYAMVIAIAVAIPFGVYAAKEEGRCLRQCGFYLHAGGNFRTKLSDGTFPDSDLCREAEMASGRRI